MKLAITSTGKELDSNLDPRFGRTSYFIIVDPETMAFEVVENSQNLNLPQGAGIQAGKTIADHHVDALITGHCGPNAIQTLSAAGVQEYVGQDHSRHYLEMANRNDRREKIEHPDGYGKRTGECGDTVEMYLSIRKGRIRSVSYETNGCINTNACANTVAELAEGRKVEDAWEITAEDVISYYPPRMRSKLHHLI